MIAIGVRFEINGFFKGDCLHYLCMRHHLQLKLFCYVVEKYSMHRQAIVIAPIKEEEEGNQGKLHK